MENKRICFVHIGMARDGAERVIAHIANTYAERGYKVDIIVLLLNDVGYELHPNVKIVSFVKPNGKSWRNIGYWIKSIRRHIIETNPSHIISFSMYVNIFTLIACIGLKKDILISERNDPSSDGRGFIDKVLTKILYNKANKIVFQTKRAQSCFSKIIRKKSLIIGNPISVTDIATDEKSNKIVTVGRLEPQKNQALLLRAFSKILPKYPNLILEIYGKGALLQELEDLASSLSIKNNVHFMGNVTNIHERIKDSKAFILSSDFEGLSNALLEAMMMGLPVVSTKCAGSDEVIRDGINGILTDLRNVEQLSQGIIAILSDTMYAKKIGYNARESVKKFQTDIVINQWLSYIGD